MDSFFDEDPISNLKVTKSSQMIVGDETIDSIMTVDANGCQTEWAKIEQLLQTLNKMRDTLSSLQRQNSIQTGRAELLKIT